MAHDDPILNFETLLRPGNAYEDMTRSQWSVVGEKAGSRARRRKSVAEAQVLWLDDRMEPVAAAWQGIEQRHLYKVPPPCTGTLFLPSDFWCTADRESGSTRAREGYLKDAVLFAGDFDEVNIHIFPRVRTVRVRSCDAGHLALPSHGPPCLPAKDAWILPEAMARWNVQACYLPDLDHLLADLRRAGIYCDEQNRLGILFSIGLSH